MNDVSGSTVFARLVIALGVSIVIVATAGAQVRDSSNAVDARLAEYQTRLQQTINNKPAYATAIVQRWEGDARSMGRWDSNYASDLLNALMQLQPENLLAAAEASSYKEVLTVLARGPLTRRTPSPDSLGSSFADLVYTPITPCRIVDTRLAGGLIAAGTTRFFDADGSDFSAQGGKNGSCGIPFGVATAAAMTVTVTQPSAAGFLTVWGLGPRPLSSVINYVANQTLANTTIVPIVPGSGGDFSLFSLVNAHAVIDVVGYYAAPVATALDCITVTNSVAVPVGSWTHATVSCPAGRTATGGGFFFPWSNWIGKSTPSGNGWDAGFYANGNADAGTVYCNCCLIPGR